MSYIYISHIMIWMIWMIWLMMIIPQMLILGRAAWSTFYKLSLAVEHSYGDRREVCNMGTKKLVLMLLASYYITFIRTKHKTGTVIDRIQCHSDLNATRPNHAKQKWHYIPRLFLYRNPWNCWFPQRPRPIQRNMILDDREYRYCNLYESIKTLFAGTSTPPTASKPQSRW